MQAAPRLRKLCLALLLTVPSAYAGELRLRLQFSASGLLHALFPYPVPTPSVHHLGMRAPADVPLHGPVTLVDGRTFVAEGVHYRMRGLPPLAPGSPEEQQAREALRRSLASATHVRVLALEASGMRIVTLGY